MALSTSSNPYRRSQPTPSDDYDKHCLESAPDQEVALRARPIETCTRGDPAEFAFALIIERYYHRVYDETRKLLKSDEGDCRDAAHDFFIKKLPRAIRNYDSRENAYFASWLFQVLNRFLKDYRRSKNTRTRILPLDSLRSLENAPSHTDSLEERIVTAHLERVVQQLLQELPLKWRAIVVAFYLEGKCINAIAHEQATTETNVKSILYRARRYLKPYAEEQRKNGRI